MPGSVTVLLAIVTLPMAARCVVQMFVDREMPPKDHWVRLAVACALALGWCITR